MKKRNFGDISGKAFPSSQKKVQEFILVEGRAQAKFLLRMQKRTETETGRLPRSNPAQIQTHRLFHPLQTPHQNPHPQPVRFITQEIHSDPIETQSDIYLQLSFFDA